MSSSGIAFRVCVCQAQTKQKQPRLGHHPSMAIRTPPRRGPWPPPLLESEPESESESVCLASALLDTQPRWVLWPPPLLESSSLLDTAPPTPPVFASAFLDTPSPTPTLLDTPPPKPTASGIAGPGSALVAPPGQAGPASPPASATPATVPATTPERWPELWLRKERREFSSWGSGQDLAAWGVPGLPAVPWSGPGANDGNASCFAGCAGCAGCDGLPESSPATPVHQQRQLNSAKTLSGSSPATPVHDADCRCEYCLFGSPMTPRAPATPPTEEATDTQLHAMIERHQFAEEATDSSELSPSQLDNAILSLSFRVPQSLRAWQPCIGPPMVWTESEPESELKCGPCGQCDTVRDGGQCDPSPAKKRRWKLQKEEGAQVLFPRLVFPPGLAQGGA